jgi:hypothetical protein
MFRGIEVKKYCPGITTIGMKNDSSLFFSGLEFRPEGTKTIRPTSFQIDGHDDLLEPVVSDKSGQLAGLEDKK